MFDRTISGPIRSVNGLGRPTRSGIESSSVHPGPSDARETSRIVPSAIQAAVVSPG
jgi:hypothetical protein